MFFNVVSGRTFCKGRPWQSCSQAPSWQYIASLGDVLRQYAPQRSFALWNTKGIRYGVWTDCPNISHATAEYPIRRMNRSCRWTESVPAPLYR